MVAVDKRLSNVLGFNSLVFIQGALVIDGSDLNEFVDCGSDSLAYISITDFSGVFYCGLI